MKRWVILGLCWACASSADDATLQEAAEIHNKAMEVAHQTGLRLSQLKRMELLPAAEKDSIQAVAEDLSEWYSLVVEVPGYKHEDHDDHHHHDHHHGESANYLEGLSAQEVLDVQRQLKHEVAALQRRLIAIEQKAAP